MNKINFNMKYLFLIPILFILNGCDSVYNYIFIPEEHVEYTIIPDREAVEALEDTSYYVSRDGLSVGYDAKDWKIEIRYMSDYQLNTFEFPDESDDKEFSANPFTYGNWIDPKLGYSPRRFSVFKVSIFNYTGSKLNFDPELSTLQTERGDFFNAYAREMKNAKYNSIEEYYTVRKGASGVDEEIFETRMGIARRQMLYLGKPIYKGDSREGLIVFDPVVESVSQLKLTINDFILAYDENNDPAEFKDLSFYFKQVEDEEVKGRETKSIVKADTSQAKALNFVQLKYVNNPDKVDDAKSQKFQVENIFNPKTEGVETLISGFERKTQTRVSYKIEESSAKLSKADIIFITGFASYPKLDTDELSAAIKNGSFVFIDIANHKDIGNLDPGKDFLTEIAKDLGSSASVKNVALDHPVFNEPEKVVSLPAGFAAINDQADETFETLGLFIDGKLAALSVKKSYTMVWNEANQTSALDFGINILNYALKN